MAAGSVQGERRYREALGIAGLAVIALLVVAPLGIVLWLAGGLRAAPSAGPPQVEPGVLIRGERFDMAVLSAVIGSGRPKDTHSDGEPYVVVDLRIENRAKEPASTSDLPGTIAVTLPDGTELDRTRLEGVLARDRFSGSLHPDMPEQVHVSWPLPEGVDRPDTVTVRVTDWLVREDFFTERVGWKIGDTLATVELPVGSGERART